MNLAARVVLIALLAAAAGGAGVYSFQQRTKGDVEKPGSPDPVDRELRTFLGIDSLRANLTLPPSSAAYPVVVLFAEGKEVGRFNGIYSSGAFSDTYRVELMWQRVESKLQRMLLIHLGNTRDLMGQYPYWAELFGGYHSWAPIALDAGVAYDGISLVGVLFGNGVQDRLSSMPAFGAATDVRRLGKYVVALGVVYGEPDKVHASFEKQEHMQ